MRTSRPPRSEAVGRAQRELRRISQGLGRRLLRAGKVQPAGYDPNRPIHTDVAVFFPDNPSKLYQLTQWLPVLQELNHTLTVSVLVRHAASFEQVRTMTTLPVLLVPRFQNLMALYERARYRAVVYVNNGFTNFQSLSYQPAAHVHVNHGESDKLCMVSNQAKAYDRVFVAGEAAVARHRAALAWFDTDKLTLVGRPQLDLAPLPSLPPFDGHTILYAPTWEGEDEANNYTSIDILGPAIARAALALPDTRFVYKPHPKIVTSSDEAVRAGHLEVLGLIEAAGDAGGRQLALLDGDVLGVLRSADLVVTDVSSIALDFLYLRPDSPLVVTDRRNDRPLLHTESPMTQAVHVLDSSDVDGLPADLARLLTDDPLAQARHEMRAFYFGDRPQGGSMTRFVEALREVIDGHEVALAELTRRR